MTAVVRVLDAQGRELGHAIAEIMVPVHTKGVPASAVLEVDGNKLPLTFSNSTSVSAVPGDSVRIRDFLSRRVDYDV